MVNDADSGIEVPIRSEYAQSFGIGASIVNDEPFPLLKGLPGYRSHRFMKDVPGIVKRRNDGYLSTAAVPQRNVVERGTRIGSRGIGVIRIHGADHPSSSSSRCRSD